MDNIPNAEDLLLALPELASAEFISAGGFKLLDGVVFSSRYLNPDKVSDRFTEVRLANPEADILLDPEFYASWLKGTPNSAFSKKEAISSLIVVAIW